jgi:predicted Zn-dependent protease
MVIKKQAMHPDVSHLKMSRKISHHSKTMTYRHFLLICSLILGAPSIAPAADINLPNIGDAAGTLMSPEEERQLGQEFMQNVRQSLTLLDDPIAEEYIQTLGDHLVSQVSDYHQQVTFFIVKDPAINAFAGPGGYIGVHTGLITSARSEGELASVLAHEISHVVQRHLLRAFETDSRMGLPTLAAILAAIIVGGNNPQVGEAVLASSIAGTTQKQLTFSRQHEQEADRVGLDILAHAGYDPRTMVSFFETLQQSNRYADNRLPEFLLTHPLTFSRVADTRNRAAQYPQIKSGDDTTFQLFQARIAVATTEKINLQTTDSAKQNATAQYRNTLTSLKKGEYEQARRGIKILLAQDPNRILYHQTAAEIELASDNIETASGLLKNSLELFPDNEPLSLLYAETLLQLEDADTTLRLLDRQIRHHPRQKRLYSLQARAAQKAGQPADAYLALAEIQILEGNTRQAIDYMELALKQTNVILHQRLAIEARLKSIKDEVRLGAQPRQPESDKTSAEHSMRTL